MFHLWLTLAVLNSFNWRAWHLRPYPLSNDTASGLYLVLVVCLLLLCWCVLLPPLPFGLPLWAAWSRLILVPPSRYRCLVCGLVALRSAWRVVVLCFCSSCAPWHQRPWPCVGCFCPLHHVACAVGVLCASSLRYSSAMIQDPHWASVKALEYPLWFLCALSSPVLCCLPAPLLSPFGPSRVGVCVFVLPLLLLLVFGWLVALVLFSVPLALCLCGGTMVCPC